MTQRLTDIIKHIRASIGVFGQVLANEIKEANVRVTTSDGSTGGSGSAGAGNQYVELNVDGTTYKILHDGTV